MNSNHHSRSAALETRYSRDQLLDLFRAQAKGDLSSMHVSDLYEEGWSSLLTDGMPNGGWARKDELKDGPPGPEICWDHDGKVQPLGLTNMTEEERAVRIAFSL